MRRFSQVIFGTVLVGVLSAGAAAADIAMLRNGFEIRHERREQSGGNTRLYFAATPDSGYVDVPTDEITGFRHDDAPPAETSSAAASQPLTPPELDRLVNAASDRHQVDRDLISSVIHAESDFNPRARSPKGAQGLMQLMPGTASRLGVGDAFQPDANVDGGTRYLRELLLRYNDDIVKALAAYNAGPQRVAQYRGVPPYRETHAYVARVIRDFNRKKLADRKTATAGDRTAGAKRAKASKKAAERKPAPAAQHSASPSTQGMVRRSGITLSSGN